MSTVAVVGGGLAGLLSAMRLQEAGHTVELREAGGHLGGMISPIRLGSVEVDSGAEAYAVRGGVVRALCDDLGLEVAPPEGTPHIWWRHGTFPMAEGVLGIPGSLEDPALGVLTEEELAVVRADAELAASVGADATTVGELVRARLGEPALTKLVTPVTQGVYSMSPDRMPLTAFAPSLLQALQSEGSLLAAVAHVRGPGSAAVEQPIGGMFQLINALAVRFEAAGGTVRTSASVSAVKRGGSGFQVGLHDGEQLDVERVVLAAPAAVTSVLLGHLGLEVPAPPVRTARSAMLAVATPALADNPVGSGVLLAERDDTLHARALTHYSAKWPWAAASGEHVLRLSYPEHVLATRADVLRDASRFVGVQIAERDVTGFASVGWESMPTRIDASNRDFIVETALEAGVDLVGAWLDGNGIAAVVAGTDRVLR
ncbi:MAG: FAD-dependent oxidoreductase [Propionibacteriaceae bacterium]|nr:FAD-dependent oxidoreductase [Propionibacteriaceae bacterium]